MTDDFRVYEVTTCKEQRYMLLPNASIDVCFTRDCLSVRLVAAGTARACNAAVRLLRDECV